MIDWISEDIASFAVFVGMVIVAAIFGGQWGASPWYATLSKPSWTPPNWAFPIAWTILYLMIAVAGWIIWVTPGEKQTLLLVLWGAQLFCNAIWSYIFFGRKEIAAGLADIVILWLLIAAFILLAWGLSQRAALLFLPYLVWVSYAAALNAVIWIRN